MPAYFTVTKLEADLDFSERLIEIENLGLRDMFDNHGPGAVDRAARHVLYETARFIDHVLGPQRLREFLEEARRDFAP